MGGEVEGKPKGVQNVTLPPLFRKDIKKVKQKRFLLAQWYQTNLFEKIIKDVQVPESVGGRTVYSTKPLKHTKIISRVWLFEKYVSLSDTPENRRLVERANTLTWEFLGCEFADDAEAMDAYNLPLEFLVYRNRDELLDLKHGIVKHGWKSKLISEDISISRF